MAYQYARFLEILKKWPGDKLRGPYCFGNYLRNSSKLWFTGDGKLIGNAEESTRRLDSLERLANNVHGTKYPTSRILPATGMNAKECSQAIFEDYQSDGKRSTTNSTTELMEKEPSPATLKKQSSSATLKQQPSSATV